MYLRTTMSLRLTICAMIGLITVLLVIQISEETEAFYEPTEYKVYNSSSIQEHPGVYGDIVAWIQEDYYTGGIWFYNISNDTAVRYRGTGIWKSYLNIYGDWIVWEGVKDKGYDIFALNMRTMEERRLSDDPGDDRRPSIYGSRVVWQDGNFDIHLYDLDTGEHRNLTSDPVGQVAPWIYGNKIVWVSSKYAKYQVSIYDIPTGYETRLSQSTGYTVDPVINRKWVAWIDLRHGRENETIYAYDREKGVEVKVMYGLGISIGRIFLYDDWLVWSDDRTGDSEIYLHDLASNQEVQVTDNEYTQTTACMYDKTIVWWDSRGSKIYMSTDLPPRLVEMPVQIAVEDIPKTIDLSEWIEDPDTAFESIHITSPSPYVVSINDLCVTFQFPEGVLEARIELVLNDDYGHSLEHIEFIIEPVNDPPSCDIDTTFHVHEDEAFLIDFTPHVWDVDNNFSDIRLDVQDGNITKDGLRLWLNVTTEVPTYSLLVWVTDGNASLRVDLHIDVIARDDPPIILPMPEITVTEDEEYAFDMEPYIMDEDTSVSEVIIMVQDASVTVDGLSLLILLTQGGITHDVVVEAVQVPWVVSGTLVVHVDEVNDPPMIETIPVQNIHEDAPRTLDLSPYIYDEEQSLADLSLSCASEFAEKVEDLSITLLFVTEVEDQVIEFTVSDDLASTRGSVKVHVVGVNDSPVVTIILPENGTRVREGKRVTLSVNWTDEDEDQVTITWMERGEVLGTSSPLEVKLKPGEHTITVEVDDGTDQVTDEVVVIVKKEQDSPAPGPIMVLVVICTAGILSRARSRWRR
jgi:beta propeller repeat protein